MINFKDLALYVLFNAPLSLYSMEAPILENDSQESFSGPTSLDILNKARLNASIKKGISNHNGMLVARDISPTYSLQDPLHVFSLLKKACLKTRELLQQSINYENSIDFIPEINHLLELLETYQQELRNITDKNNIKVHIDNTLQSFEYAIKQLDEKNKTSSVLSNQLNELLTIIYSAQAKSIKLGAGPVIPASERYHGNPDIEQHKHAIRVNELSHLPYTQTEAQMRIFPNGKGDGSTEDIENTVLFLRQQPELRRYFPQSQTILKQRLNEILTEERRHPDKVVLYSAASTGNFSLIMLFTSIRELLKLREEENLRTIRLLTPLKRSIEEFYASIFDGGENDQGPIFARNGLSTSLSIVDYHSTEAALPFWLRNSNTRHNFGEKLQQVLKELNIEFNPNANNSPLERAFHEMVAYQKDFSGSLLQFFVDPEVINEVAWPAKPFGLKMEYQLSTDQQEVIPINNLKDLIILLRSNPLNFNKLRIKELNHSSWSENEDKERALFTNMQARLFINPKLLLDPNYIIIKDYYLKEPAPEKYRKYKQAIDKLATLILEAYLNKEHQGEENILNQDIDGSPYPLPKFQKIIQTKGEALNADKGM
ncbi:hypothetical protein [Candidatus Odyssella thessalonicensis]|uniref:hypothetical protein n=1 Tax=Candidatus Odyssella thessalonicensis TaxID=84647 RepID=UPI000225B1FF|nr:hypothetical protein [Candidatus Odyssella thessalonicensis]